MATITGTNGTTLNYDTIGKVVIANKMTGSSIANRINNAIGELNTTGATSGEVRVYDGGNLDTPIVVPDGVRLRLMDGNYYFGGVDGNKIFFNDHFSLIGESWNTILHEREIPHGNQDFFMIVSAKASNATPPPTATTPGAVVRNIEIANLQLRGNRGNWTTATTANISGWNAKNMRIHDVYFNEITGYCCQLGAASDNLTDAITVKKQWADGFHYYNNRMENCASQHLGGPGGQYFFVHHNEIVNPGKKPIKIVSIAGNPAVVTIAEGGDFIAGRAMTIRGAKRADGTASAELNKGWTIGTVISKSQFQIKDTVTGATVDVAALGGYTANSGETASQGANYTAIFDFESNDNSIAERTDFFNISHNNFDLREATVPCHVISVVTAASPSCKGGTISDNVAIAAPGSIGSMSNGITVAYEGTSAALGNSAQDVNIHDNRFTFGSGNGMYLEGSRINAHHNTFIDMGGNVTAQIQCWNLINSQVTDNTIENPTRQTSKFGIDGNSYNNKILRNNIGGEGNANGGSLLYHGRVPGGGGLQPSPQSVHHNIFAYNILDGDANSNIQETALSNYNTYTGNLSGLGVSKVGANSKIITDEFLDGSILITNLVVPVNAVSTSGLTNFARAAGAAATASANYTNGADVTAAAYAIDGTRAANYPAIAHSTGAVPYTLDIDFGASRIIKIVNIFFYDGDNKTEPTVNTALAQFPFKKFNVRYWDGAGWILKSTEANNTKALKQFDWTSAPVTTTKIRFEVTDVSANNGNTYARIEEIEAFG